MAAKKGRKAKKTTKSHAKKSSGSTKTVTVHGVKVSVHAPSRK